MIKMALHSLTRWLDKTQNLRVSWKQLGYMFQHHQQLLLLLHFPEVKKMV